MVQTDGLIVIQGTGIASALVQAQKLINSVEKGSKHVFGYHYASSEAVIAEGRKALNGADLALMSSWDFQSMAGVDMGVVGHVRVTYTLMHASGESKVFDTNTPVIVERGRPMDKALASALSYNLGYTLRNLLLIPRGEEDSVDSRNDGEIDKPAKVATISPVKAAPVAQVTLDQVKVTYARVLTLISKMKSEEDKTVVRDLIKNLPDGCVEKDALVKSYKEATKPSSQVSA